MSIILFAIIGAKCNLGAIYWILFGAYCLGKVCLDIYKASKENDGGNNNGL